jgi:hypothetical protein
VKRSFIFLLFVLFLQGCSVTRLAYNNADTFLRWQANSYFDFEGEQSDELDQRIAGFLAWHRAKALPQYARLAEDAATRLLRGVKREDLDWGYDAFRVQALEALDAAVAESAGPLDRLRPEQWVHLERRFAEDNRKFEREQLRGTVEERRKRRLKRNLDRLDEWFGPLSDEQVARVRRYADSAPLVAEHQDRYRRRRQTEFLAMLRAREARQKLQAWARAWETDRDPEYVRLQAEMSTEYAGLLLDLDRLLVPEQRERAAARLRRYATLFSGLSKE